MILEKLVRDNSIIEDDMYWYVHRPARNEAEFQKQALLKIEEEASEADETLSLEELADLFEIANEYRKVFLKVSFRAFLKASLERMREGQVFSLREAGVLASRYPSFETLSILLRVGIETMEANTLTTKDLLRAKIEKRRRYGGFKKRIISHIKPKERAI